ncbi:MAG: hypothetical protein V1917_02455 [Candidatus Gottesmanbacteria bacterium]
MLTNHPPAFLQPYLWSTNVQQINIQKDKWYIIHQLLYYGNIKELQWLFSTYSQKEIVDTFIKQPAKMYSSQAYLFVKNYLLSLSRIHLNKDDYVTSISGPVRQRASDHIS